MNLKNKPALSRRRFVKSVLAGTAALGLQRSLATSVEETSFSLLVLGDLHFDKLTDHNLQWLERDKPDDVRQIRDYSRISAEIMPQLFARVRETIAQLNRAPDTRVGFTLQVGDLVEGLCGDGKLAVQQNNEALDFVRGADLGSPFLFTKGNHDITGPGAVEAFQQVFHPFLEKQATPFNGGSKLDSASYAFVHGGAQFCFMDAYDKESLGWLESCLAKRTARHCFVIVHPPVVPYGARSNWILFPSERQQTQRQRLMELLGKHRAFVLTGHIHKYNLLARTTPGGGRFLQLGICSVIPAAEVQPVHVLSGASQYTADQVGVEPSFSPASEKERRAMYPAEMPYVKQFEYADLPGYGVLRVNGPQVSMKIYSGIGHQLWRSLDLTQLLEG